jgi:hypothetical protein
MVLRLAVYRWCRLDYHARISQRRSSRPVSRLDAGTILIRVCVGPAEQHGGRQCRGGRHRRTQRSRDRTCTCWGKMTRGTADDAAVLLGYSVCLHLLRVHLHTQICSVCCTAVPKPNVSMPVGELPHLPPLSQERRCDQPEYS